MRRRPACHLPTLAARAVHANVVARGHAFFRARRPVTARQALCSELRGSTMPTPHLSPFAFALLGSAALALVPLGCSSGGSGEGPRPETLATSTTAAAEPTNVVVGIPVSATDIGKIVNPKNQVT